jgi:serine/threonine protein phosphatase 1
MKTLVKRFTKNTKGRDLIIGDIHGCFTKMGQALRAVGFNPDAGDRLFSVGDLVDRGPESIEALNFITCDFVHAVGGNHEDMAVRWPNGNMPADNYRANGGAWMMALDRETQLEVSHALSALPVAIELETEHGLVGIVHAECPFDDWHAFTAKLEDASLPAGYLSQMIDAAQWARDRINSGDDSMVAGVRAVVVGHTPMQQMTSLGNTLFIDTMGWRPEGKFTILDAATLQPARRA